MIKINYSKNVSLRNICIYFGLSIGTGILQIDNFLLVCIPIILLVALVETDPKYVNIFSVSIKFFRSYNLHF